MQSVVLRKLRKYFTDLDICECVFSKKELQQALMELVPEPPLGHGDSPASAIEPYTKPKYQSEWKTICDCDTGDLIATGRTTETDWYFTTLKNLVVRPDFRGHKLAKEITQRLVDNEKKKKTPVIVADVTEDNIASRKTLEGFGFKPKTTFCWKKGETPAKILHYVLYSPSETQCK